MLQPLQDGGIILRLLLCIFPPCCWCNSFPAVRPSLPSAGGPEGTGPVAFPLPSWSRVKLQGQGVALSPPAAPAPTIACVTGQWLVLEVTLLLLRSLWRGWTPDSLSVTAVAWSPKPMLCLTPPRARAPTCPLASDLQLHQGLSNGSSSRFWLIWVPFSG